MTTTRSTVPPEHSSTEKGLEQDPVSDNSKGKVHNSENDDSIDPENEVQGVKLLLIHTAICLCTFLVGLVSRGGSHLLVYITLTHSFKGLQLDCNSDPGHYIRIQLYKGCGLVRGRLPAGVVSSPKPLYRSYTDTEPYFVQVLYTVPCWQNLRPISQKADVSSISRHIQNCQLNMCSGTVFRRSNYRQSNRGLRCIRYVRRRIRSSHHDYPHTQTRYMD